MNTKPLLYLAFANDRSGNESFLSKLKEERHAIPKALQRATDQGWCDTHVEPDATADDLFADFNNAELRSRIAVFHYAGHASGTGWHLENEDSLANKIAHIEGTAGWLCDLPNLELIFLNGCNTQEQIESIHAQCNKNIVATAAAINDDVAVDFAKAFYIMAYAQEDKEQADQLGKFLKVLKRTGLINTFKMHENQAGTEVEKEVKRQLLNAKIILLLISSDFLIDDLCNEIEETAMKRHYDQTAAVIPVWLKDVPLDDNFGFTKLQGLPFNGIFVNRWADKDTAFTEISKGIQELAKRLGSRK
ncbi:MAG: TIR domain-containing protein [Sphingobacteriales bacterium]|nr:TIR domain-containing protein [Sphingobacteriales bacterium]